MDQIWFIVPIRHYTGYIHQTINHAGRLVLSLAFERRWALFRAGSSLRRGPFDLCLTAGPGEDVSEGSCVRLISHGLTQAQLVDSRLWDSAGKLSGPLQINHWRGFHAGYRRLWPLWPGSLSLLTLSYRRVMIFEERRHTVAFFVF